MKHDLEAEELRRQGRELGARLSAEQLERLLRFEVALVQHALPLGLIAEGDARNIRRRHTLDSLRAVPAMEEATDAYDLGSGAGLPGVVLAIACPDVRFGLVDSRRKRISFLEFAVEMLGLPNAVPIGARAEAIREPVDVCLARAFAPLPRAWEISEPLLRPDGRLIYFAGREGAGVGAGRPPPAVGARLLRVLGTSVLESAGPLVIMTRQ